MTEMQPTLKTYYFCFECRPSAPSDSRPTQAGMIADVFAVETTPEEAEEKITAHLRNTGWEPTDLQHFEEVSEVSVHDSRLTALFKAARRDGIATLYSPYD